MTAQSRNISVKFLFSRLALTLVVLAGFLGISPRPVSAGTCGSTVIVSSTLDSGADTLRQAIAGVCDNGTIIFDRSLSGTTITLASVLTIDKNMTIDGSTLTDQITLSGGNSTQIFYINNSRTLALKSIKVMNGRSVYGGGIFNQGTLTITNSTITDNIATLGDGGGIYNHGSLTAINCTFSGNSVSIVSNSGGAILNLGTLVVKNSTFSGNSASSGSSIANNSGYTTTLVNSSFYGNSGGAQLKIGEV
jgi:hypothetical protein